MVAVDGTAQVRLGSPADRPIVVDVRAFVRADSLWPTKPDTSAPISGATPWQNRPVASPLSHYPGHEVRSVGGPSWVGHVVVQVESSNGHVGTGCQRRRPCGLLDRGVAPARARRR